jgi:hypothetical protein
MGIELRAKREMARMAIVPQSEKDLANTDVVLWLKPAKHPGLKQNLLGTGDEAILEACTKRHGRECGANYDSVIVPRRLRFGLDARGLTPS